jgi:hypothetical protein
MNNKLFSAALVIIAVTASSYGLAAEAVSVSAHPSSAHVSAVHTAEVAHETPVVKPVVKASVRPQVSTGVVSHAVAAKPSSASKAK